MASSIQGEARIGSELRTLLRDPVYAGVDVPRGDGRLVLVLPGLFANDFYLNPLHRWLKRIGYTPLRSTLLMNVGCPQRLCEQIEDHVRERRESFRRPGSIAIIGHSRGGILGWTIAARMQDEVSHLALLGSPAQWASQMVGRYTPAEAARAAGGAPAGPAVQRASDRARAFLDPDCDMPRCGCPFPRDLQRPLHIDTRVTSIYTREDPIVPAAACPVPGAHNVEVGGSHSGLAYNVTALRVIGEALAA
jgi:pimeloyl-ACP methyl ester carboxylesterase